MIALVYAVRSLVKRELILFYRARSRLIGALLQPFVFWLLIGSGFDGSLRMSGQEQFRYSDYFFPGIILMVILFTAIFSTITIIDDRNKGFLKGVLAAPVPRLGIVLGKVTGGAVLSVVQGLLFVLLVFTPLVHIELTVTGLVQLTACMVVLGVALTGLGLIMAWHFESVQGYHAVMSIALFPMWIFSGAVFPIAGTPLWMNFIMKVNPLTYGLNILRESFVWSGVDGTAATASVVGSWIALLTFAAATLTIATVVVSRTR